MRYRLSKDVTYEDFGEEIVVYHSVNNESFALNKVGRLLLLGLEAGFDSEELFNKISSAVSKERATLSSEIQNFLDELLKAAIIEINGS